MQQLALQSHSVPKRRERFTPGRDRIVIRYSRSRPWRLGPDLRDGRIRAGPRQM